MSENKIAYTSRTYDDCKNEIIKLTQQYYPDLFDRLDDASIGSWLIEMVSDVYDALNFHIDRTYQETMIDSAKQKESLTNIARTNGLRIPGRKAALCEAEISCIVPIDSSSGDLRLIDYHYCPVVKRGSLFSSGSETFELMYDIDFNEQFNQNGQSDRTIEPIRNSNGVIINYKVKKLCVVQSGYSKIYKKSIIDSDIKPFMDFTITDNNILGVESVIVKQGTNFTNDPLTTEFFVDKEDYTDKTGVRIKRFFEVDNLIDQYRFGYEIDENNNENGYYNPIWEDIEESVSDLFEVEEKGDEQGKYILTSDSKERYDALFGQPQNDDDYGIYGTDVIITNENKKKYVRIQLGSVVVSRCVKGQWKRLKNKFTTEFDDDGNLKVIFGAGLENSYGEIPENAEEFTQYMMSRMEANDYMGVLPQSGNTLYIMYRVGGGEITNIAAGTLTNIIYNNFEIPGNCDDPQNNVKKNSVRGSFSVTNTTPSYGGKDAPSEDEIKWMIKYNNASQNRCVTLHDYKIKLNQLPAKFGCPFRTSVVEENNKIKIYALGLNSEGVLMKELAEPVADNIIAYLSHYKMINDLIEIHPGKIINIKFKVTIYVDKSYDKAEVTKRVIDEIYDYMDIRKHEMGEDIFLGDLSKTISQLDGVINLVKMQCYNPTRNDMGGDYSEDEIAQELINPLTCEEYQDSGHNDDRQIDLDSSDLMLFSESNSMYEILNKNTDIDVVVKTR